MIFQDSIGIEIRPGEVILAHVKKTFGGAGLGAHAVYAMESGESVRERLEEIASFLSEFRRENRIGTRNLVIGIPREQVIFRVIEYPAAVKENLRSTLEYDIDKYIPLSADEICFDHQIIQEDRENNRLRVLLAFVKKTDLEPYLAFCRRWPGGVFGLCVPSAAVANAHAFLSGNKAHPLDGYVDQILMKAENTPLDAAWFPTSLLNKAGIPSPDLVPAFGLALAVLWDAPVRINLLPQEARKKPSRVGFYALIGLFVLFILAGAAWGGGHLLRQKSRLEALDREIRHLSSEVAAITEMEGRIKVLDRKIDALTGQKGQADSLLEILRELTRIIPETAWVTDFTLTDKDIRLSGFAQSASDLVSLLESSSLFEDVVFLSAIVKDNQMGKDRFFVGFKSVKPEPSGKANDSLD